MEQLIDETSTKKNSKQEQSQIDRVESEFNAKIENTQKNGEDNNLAIADAEASKLDTSASIANSIDALIKSVDENDQQSDEYLNILKIATEGNKIKVEEEVRFLKIATEENKLKIEENVRILKMATEANKRKATEDLQIVNSGNDENINKRHSLRQEKAGLVSNNREFADMLSSIQYFESFFKWVSDLLGTPPFWALPKSILTLLLVLSTGVLGSIIFVTVEFLKEPEYHIQNLSMYIFRPLLGMILALSMYVMLKAGQFTFVDDSNQNLSPFLVSFLGIISGMLAEEAYHRLTKTGEALINEKHGNGTQKGV